MDQNYDAARKSAALVMIYLTLSIIFITAHSLRVEAAFIATVTGQDGVPDFRRANDTTTVTVLADTDLVSILGSIAIGILSGVCGRMTPSLPPGLEGHPVFTGAPAHWWHAFQNAIHRHAFENSLGITALPPKPSGLSVEVADQVFKAVSVYIFSLGVAEG